jgi:hypothetical protein
LIICRKSIGSSDYDELNVEKYIKSLILKFESSFQNRCLKYPFVNRWVDLLENKRKRSLIFVYQEENLVQGGLGDRLGGLISAVLMALRF